VVAVEGEALVLDEDNPAFLMSSLAQDSPPLPTEVLGSPVLRELPDEDEITGTDRAHSPFSQSFTRL